MKSAIYLLSLLLSTSTACTAQNRPKENVTILIDDKCNMLRQQLHDVIKMSQAKIGVAMVSIEDGDTLTINNHHAYPMQSVYKFPLAMAVLDQVDKGKLSLDQKVPITKADLREKTWSPLREKHPDGNINMTVAELLKYTVSMSDNNTCDVLFRLIKGTSVADNYVKQLGIKDIAIKTTEQEMTTAWDVQYKNHATPYAMAKLLDIFYSKKSLSPASTGFLLKLMTESSNSDKRIKGLLPQEATVAHKTGTSDTNKDGLTAAVNDIGIVTLPDGKHFAIAVFVSDSKDSNTDNEKIIAMITSHVYNFLGMRSVGKQ